MYYFIFSTVPADGHASSGPGASESQYNGNQVRVLYMTGTRKSTLHIFPKISLISLAILYDYIDASGQNVYSRSSIATETRKQTCQTLSPRPVFTKQTGVLPQNLVKARSREIGSYKDRIALKFDRHLGAAAAEVPVKFQSDWKSRNPNLVASGLNEILRWDVCPLCKHRPRTLLVGGPLCGTCKHIDDQNWVPSWNMEGWYNITFKS